MFSLLDNRFLRKSEKVECIIAGEVFLSSAKSFVQYPLGLFDSAAGHLVSLKNYC